ncbi:hypothetical protein AB0I95_26350 [Micromonospora sp. NPDC049751]|uniref:hypothetical protein n=1 Tax=unclassified Micromonospora TaxID=2617518 RepID=UPI0033FFDDB1
MPEPQPGARPADGRTPGPRPDDAPAVADESTSPPVPPNQPAAPDGPEPPVEPTAAAPAEAATPEPAAKPDPTAKEPAAEPDPTAQKPAAEPDPTAQKPAAGPDPTAKEPAAEPEPADKPEPHPTSPAPAAETRPAAGPEPTARERVGGGPDSPAAPPAPRWSGSAPVPPALPRRRAWGESAEPTPPPLPEQPLEHRTPVDPWAGVDTGGWDLPSAELPPLPPTLGYPVPPATRQWSGPPVGAHPVSPPPVGTHPVSPPPHHQPAGHPPPAYLPPVAYPPPHARPAPPHPPTAAGPAAPVRPAPPARVPKQRRGRGPTAPPPLGEAPKGYPPPRPRRRRRRWPWLLLLSLACCCGCPAYYGLPISSQYPASAALPEQVADLSLRQDDGSSETAKQLEKEVRQEHLLAEDTFAGVYRTADGKQVTVFGGTGFRLTPEADADEEITRLGERYALEAPETVRTGVRGRYERCAIGRPAGGDVVVCTSVDHGSIATGVFTRLSVSDSATLLDTLRTQIVQPKQG